MSYASRPAAAAARRSSQQRYRESVAYDRRLSTPWWVPMAQIDYETGSTACEIARHYLVSKASVTIYCRQLEWNRSKHAQARSLRRYPWAANIRPMFEDGVHIDTLIRLACVGETTIINVAKRFKWN